MTNDLNIPSFLKREETPEQAEKRRAKNAPKSDSKGLKVITPPDPKIMAAVAKDFKESKSEKTAVERINEERAKDGLRPYTPNAKKKADIVKAAAKDPQKRTEKEKGLVSDAARARKAAAKDPILQKALKERDELNAKAADAKEKSAKSASKQKTAEKPAKKSADRSKSKAKAELMLQALARKNGVDNKQLAEILGRRPSSASMKLVCQTHGKKLKIVKREGEPTRYLTA